MDLNKNKQSDELLKRIRDELHIIMEENASNDPERKISIEDLMQPNPLPILEASKSTKKPKTQKKSGIYRKPQTYRQSMGGKSITMNPTQQRSTADQEQSSTIPSSTPSVSSLPSHFGSLDCCDPREFIQTPTSKSIDEDMQKMQMELLQSYKLFQDIGEKLESINFSGLKTRIRNLNLHKTHNDVVTKAEKEQMHKMLESRYMKNNLDKLTKDVSADFRRHPGEFGDIPELSRFFQACSQLERGLDTLKQQRKRSNDMEKRLSWATEIAYDRMEEIRNSLGEKPEKNF